MSWNKDKPLQLPGQGAGAASGAAGSQQRAAADRRSSAWAALQEKSLGTGFLPPACKVCVPKPPQS